MNQTSKLINTKPVKPQRITARQQRELLCVIEMQEREWLSIDEVDLDGYGGLRFERILEDIHQVRSISGTPILSDREPI